MIIGSRLTGAEIILAASPADIVPLHLASVGPTVEEAQAKIKIINLSLFMNLYFDF